MGGAKSQVDRGFATSHLNAGSFPPILSQWFFVERRGLQTIETMGAKNRKEYKILGKEAQCTTKYHRCLSIAI